jgi:hypothetical protein
MTWISGGSDVRSIAKVGQGSVDKAQVIPRKLQDVSELVATSRGLFLLAYMAHQIKKSNVAFLLRRILFRGERQRYIFLNEQSFLLCCSFGVPWLTVNSKTMVQIYNKSNGQLL